jgi:hypothetical protein
MFYVIHLFHLQVRKHKSLPSTNIWRLVIDNFGLNGVNRKKVRPEEEKQVAKKKV